MNEKIKELEHRVKQLTLDREVLNSVISEATEELERLKQARRDEQAAIEICRWARD